MVGSLLSLAVLYGCFAVAETQGTKCVLNEICYSVGYTLDINCQTYTCTKESNPEEETISAEFRITTHRCRVNGRCYSVGETLTSDCRTRTCTMETLPDGTATLQIPLTRNRCTDYYGACHDDGATLVPYMNPDGALLRDCTCFAPSTGIRYFECNFRRVK